MKLAESRLRTMTEETDTLTFNNARLTKRVAVLQEAIEEEKEKAASTSGWFGSGAKAELARVQQQMQVLRDELEVKIKENEELHMRIFETAQETGTIKEDLQDRISKLKTDVKSKSEQLDDLAQTHKHTVTRLTSENSALQTRSEELSDTLHRTKSLMQQREHTMTQAQLQLTSERDAAQAIITAKLPFNDTANATQNRLNLPPHDNFRATKLFSLSNAAITLFKKFIGFWKDWCDAEHEKMLYLNQSANDTPDELKQINRRLGTHINEFPGVLTAIASAFASFMTSETLSPESVTHKQEIQLHLQRFVSLHEKTALAFKSRFDAEKSSIKMFVNNESARSYNAALGENWLTSHTHLEKLVSYFTIFCGATEMHHDESSPAASNALFALQNALSAALDLRSTLKERSSLIQNLSNLELQHDAFMSNDIKMVNTRRVSAIANATALLDKIGELLSEYIGNLPISPNTRVRGAICDLPDGLYPLDVKMAKTRNFMKSLYAETSQHTSIPYAEALETQKKLGELAQTLRAKDADMVTLKQQLAQQVALTDRAGQEVRTAREALAAQQKGLQDALTELAEAKLRLQNQAQNPASSTSEIPSSTDKAPESTPEHAQKDLLLSSTESPAPPTYTSFLPTHPHQTTSTDMPQTISAQTLPADFLNTPSLSLSAFLAMSGGRPGQQSSVTPSDQPSVDLLTDMHTSSDLSSLTPSPSPTPSTPNQQSASNKTSKRPWTMSVVEDPTYQSAIPVSDQDKEREEQLKRFYEQRVQSFQAKIDFCDKKNVELYQQVLDLERRLKETIGQRETLKQELDAAGQRALVGTDELETTRSSYNTQIQTLTEHMVGLSDKISTYEEQLSTLKNSTVRCGRCKTWNTIEWLMGEGQMGQRCSHGNHPSSFNYS